MESYWGKRLTVPRNFTLIANISNTLYQVDFIMNPTSTRQLCVSVVYMINSLIIYALVLPSFWNQKYNKLVRFGFMLMALRNIIYLYDIEENKENIGAQSWMLFSMIGISTTCFNAALHF